MSSVPLPLKPERWVGNRDNVVSMASQLPYWEAGYMDNPLAPESKLDPFIGSMPHRMHSDCLVAGIMMMMVTGLMVVIYFKYHCLLFQNLPHLNFIQSLVCFF